MDYQSSAACSAITYSINVLLFWFVIRVLSIIPVFPIHFSFRVRASAFPSSMYKCRMALDILDRDRIGGWFKCVSDSRLPTRLLGVTDKTTISTTTSRSSRDSRTLSIYAALGSGEQIQLAIEDRESANDMYTMTMLSHTFDLIIRKRRPFLCRKRRIAARMWIIHFMKWILAGFVKPLAWRAVKAARLRQDTSKNVTRRNGIFATDNFQRLWKWGSARLSFYDDCHHGDTF